MLTEKFAVVKLIGVAVLMAFAVLSGFVLHHKAMFVTQPAKKNLIYGGGFEDGELQAKGWYFDHLENIQHSRNCSRTAENCTVHMKALKSGQAFTAQLVYAYLPVKAGKTYRLEYTLCSAAGQPDDIIMIQIMSRDGSFNINGDANIYQEVSGGKCVNVTRRVTMTRTEADRLSFAFGLNEVEWIIDNVSMYEVED